MLNALWRRVSVAVLGLGLAAIALVAAPSWQGPGAAVAWQGPGVVNAGAAPANWVYDANGATPANWATEGS